MSLLDPLALFLYLLNLPTLVMSDTWSILDVLPLAWEVFSLNRSYDVRYLVQVRLSAKHLRLCASTTDEGAFPYDRHFPFDVIKHRDTKYIECHCQMGEA